MLEDRNWIKTVVDMRDADAIVIPLYIQIYGKKYSILDMNSIKKRFAPSAFKIGYGTADSMFMKNSFPVNRINEFDLVDTFYEYDSENDINVRYTVFESGDVDDIESNKLNQEIHMYFDLLFNNVKENVDAYFKSLIESESVPIIPKDKPKKEEVPMQVGIKEYTGDLSKYCSSWDPKFVNEGDEEDSLDELGEEASEDLIRRYKGMTDIIPGLIVETDNTGTEIKKATSVEFITQDETDDDYLSEESVMFNEGFLNYEDDEDDDYSTDFDIF